MSKIIIGIHGLGNKVPHSLLEKWWKEALLEGFGRIDQPEYFFKFEMAYWANVLHPKSLDPDIIDKEDPLCILEPYFPSHNTENKEPGKFRQRVLDFFEKQLDKLFLNPDKSINLSVISDMIIHKYFEEFEIYYSSTCLDESKIKCLARDIIREKLITVLRKHKRKDILLIAHSMGTIIAYDVLTQLSNELEIDTFVTIGSPLGIAVVMKKIATEQNIELTKTKMLRTPENIKRAWYNFSDLHDKVALNYNLADDYTPNSAGIKAVDKIVYNNYEIDGERNPHKSYGYLRTPELAQVVYDFLLRDRNKISIWFNQRAAAIFDKIF